MLQWYPCFLQCGNNIVEFGEECDGNSIKGQTCEDVQGYM